MRRLLLYIITLIVTLSCGTTKKLPPVQTITKDSIIYKERTVFVNDTILVEIPAQQAERTTRDTISKLETDYAASTAQILTDGSLYHDIKNKAQKKPIQHDMPVIYRDSIVYKYEQVQVPYPVERELSLWERISIKYFKIILPLLIGLIVFIFRKPLINLVRRFI